MKDVNDGIVNTPSKGYNSNQSHGTVAVRSAFPAIVERTGQVTGKQYRWDYAGYVLDVDERDVPQLLTLRFGGTGCCGNKSDGISMFEKV